MQDILYNLLHDSSMQAGLAGSDHAMRKDRTCHMFDVIRDDVVSSRNGGVGLAGTVESKCTTGTDTQFNGVMVAGCADQLNDLAFNAGINAHAPNELLQAL